MTLAYWCVVLAMFLPWLCAYYSKKVGGFSGNDNHYPRDFLGSTQGEAKRADAAQKNSFEIFYSISVYFVCQYSIMQCGIGCNLYM